MESSAGAPSLADNSASRLRTCQRRRSCRHRQVFAVKTMSARPAADMAVESVCPNSRIINLQHRQSLLGVISTPCQLTVGYRLSRRRLTSTKLLQPTFRWILNQTVFCQSARPRDTIESCSLAQWRGSNNLLPKFHSQLFLL